MPAELRLFFPMPPRFRRLVLTALGTCIALPTLQASGTYPPAPPRLRADVTRSVDPAAYNLGKAIFTGRAALEANPAATSDQVRALRERLTSIVERIPARARQEIDVNHLAPRLDAAAAEALFYYLELRFQTTGSTP